MSGPQGAVYDLLLRQPGSCSAATLAAVADRHPNTMRKHLSELVESGVIKAIRAAEPRRGPGRPAVLYLAVGHEPEQLG